MFQDITRRARGGGGKGGCCAQGKHFADIRVPQPPQGAHAILITRIARHDRYQRASSGILYYHTGEIITALLYVSLLIKSWNARESMQDTRSIFAHAMSKFVKKSIIEYHSEFRRSNKSRNVQIYVSAKVSDFLPSSFRHIDKKPAVLYTLSLLVDRRKAFKDSVSIFRLVTMTMALVRKTNERPGAPVLTAKMSFSPIAIACRRRRRSPLSV